MKGQLRFLNTRVGESFSAAAGNSQRTLEGLAGAGAFSEGHEAQGSGHNWASHIWTGAGGERQAARNK